MLELDINKRCSLKTALDFINNPSIQLSNNNNNNNKNKHININTNNINNN